MLMLPNAYSHCLFIVTVSDMKSRSAHAFMCVMMMVVVVVVVVVVMCVCLCVCVCANVHGMGNFHCNRLR